MHNRVLSGKNRAQEPYFEGADSSTGVSFTQTSLLQIQSKIPFTDNLSVFFSDKIISLAHKARLQAKPQSSSFRSVLFLVNKMLLKSGATWAGLFQRCWCHLVISPIETGAQKGEVNTVEHAVQTRSWGWAVELHERNSTELFQRVD